MNNSADSVACAQFIIDNWLGEYAKGQVAAVYYSDSNWTVILAGIVSGRCCITWNIKAQSYLPVVGDWLTFVISDDSLQLLTVNDRPY